jgi:predicted HTH domain antitoxin
MSSKTISARFPKDKAKIIEEIAREEKVDKSTILNRALDHYIREWRIRKAVESYREGLATLPRAAEIAGVTVWEMIDVLSQRNVQQQYTAEDLEEDLKALQRG